MRLDIRPMVGRGGNAGLRYQVRIDSLPAELQARYWELNGGRPVEGEPADEGEWTPPAMLPRPSVHFDRQAERRRRIVDELRRAPDRARALADIAERERLSPHTLRRWLRREDDEGMFALGRKARADRGKRRTFISRAWDEAARQAGLEDEALQAMRDRVIDRIRSAWRSGSASG